ncbi:alpha/beta-hydrolase [Stereum hirsutum FP-91666 SS1]|uniref:alpha/beta-hydrolase n=1 Tax=Stereum hirsutum (strain FP-91666) TaxID=721885 RepID=UPI000440F9A0|nr:alpha/beta-hydrolase [Stereum hirsutum FP-91666 SS1]EIM89469.1 alpha/beta-hydrolase [Stereum hirsutum FP-91666 SS1]
MVGFSTTPHGPFGVCDTGIPSDTGHSYVTLLLIHGFAWHGGNFARLLPHASSYGIRIILLNRRDYPGSSPLTDDQHSRLHQSLSDDDDSRANIQQHMNEQAKELYDFLEAFAREEKLAPRSMIVGGWSFGSAWITAILAYASSLPLREDADPPSLGEYVRYILLYDPPYHALGYPPPPNPYRPLSDPSLTPEEGIKIFPAWVSGYYHHPALESDSSPGSGSGSDSAYIPNSPSALECRTPLDHPKPTILTMSENEIAAGLFTPPGAPGGSDDVVVRAGEKHGLYALLRERAVYLDGEEHTSNGASPQSGGWRDVGIRYLWCDQSAWQVPWGMWAMQGEIREAEAAGRRMREVEVVRLSGANHFAHWDQPERTLKAMLAESE